MDALEVAEARAVENQNGGREGDDGGGGGGAGGGFSSGSGRRRFRLGRGGAKAPSSSSNPDASWKRRRQPWDLTGALGIVAGFQEGIDGEDNGDDAGGGDGDENMADGVKSSAQKKRRRSSRKRRGRWVDFPTDAALSIDRYQSSLESKLSKREVTERLRSNVRRKLVLGGGGGGQY